MKCNFSPYNGFHNFPLYKWEGPPSWLALHKACFTKCNSRCWGYYVPLRDHFAISLCYVNWRSLALWKYSHLGLIVFMWFFLGMPCLQEFCCFVLRAPLLLSFQCKKNSVNWGLYNLQVKLQWHSFCPFSRGLAICYLVKKP
jgi:hypothetical protein